MVDYTLFEGKTILITGGTGSIGNSLVIELLKTKCNAIRILSNNEHELFTSQLRFNDSRLRYLLGDVRDKTRMNSATEGVDIVFHAAALKHVPICEYNPFDAIQTNVLGTQNIIEASIDSKVEKFVFISTDKATNPLSTLGATKLLAERLAISTMNVGRSEGKTTMHCVRFGNVIGTRGSVFEIFLEQIKKGKPLTITSNKMTRFTMTPKQAVDLILSTCEIAKGGEIFVLKMDAIRIIDLAQAMIEEYGKNSKNSIDETGIRPGEKINEYLLTEEEAIRTRDLKTMFVIPWFNDHSYDNLPQIEPVYASDKIKPLSVEEIRSMLRELSSEN